MKGFAFEGKDGGISESGDVASDSFFFEIGLKFLVGWDGDDELVADGVHDDSAIHGNDRRKRANAGEIVIADGFLSVNQRIVSIWGKAKFRLFAVMFLKIVTEAA